MFFTLLPPTTSPAFVSDGWVMTITNTQLRVMDDDMAKFLIVPGQ